MITKFRLYETLNQGHPEIGDYAIIDYSDNEKSQLNKNYYNFITSMIGKIVEPNPYWKDKFLFQIDYGGDIFNYGGTNYRLVKSNQIRYWSKNKEDLEFILLQKKFGL